MHVIRARNVNGAFRRGLSHLLEVGVKQDSRGGPVIVAPHPVVTVYERPCERVLLDPKRDANPFFHLFEGLWMLSGRDDAFSLNRYVSDFGERFAEPDGTIHGAYGRRWRRALGYDQLDQIVSRLRSDPLDRQCVLQIWDSTVLHGVELGRHGVGDDWIDAPVDAGQNDLLGRWRDRPCNTHVYFRVREETSLPLEHTDPPYYMKSVLDMTVCCRSNDVVWGAYGANAVHFSMLMEYVAGRVGVQVGTMHQLSNNFHGYVDALDRLGDPARLSSVDPYEETLGAGVALTSVPMGTEWERWDVDLRTFMDWHDAGCEDDAGGHSYFNSWFAEVAEPMCVANQLRRRGRLVDAFKVLGSVVAQDWRRAGQAWISRRYLRSEQPSIGDVR